MKKVISFIRHKFSRLGPGFITGAADDDPAGIATYSITGAKFGYKLSWLSIFLVPMMYTIQEMCGRIGLVSGMGLAAAIKKYYPKKLLYFAVALLFFANTFNIGADLGIMASSLQMIIGLPFVFWLFFVTIVTLTLEIIIPYSSYSRYLKWMALSVLVYGITAFIIHQDWIAILRYTFIPYIELELGFIMTIVGCLGTTISPYLFFWQASEQVEEHIKEGKIQDFDESPQVLEVEIKHMRKDTIAGMSFANIIFFFIVITTAATLNRNGIFDIESPAQAATALRPLAGNLAYILFTIGIVGIGLESVPTLAGSAAYAIADTFGFKEGLAKKLTEARAFYAVIGLATIIGVLFNFIGINPVRALFYSAIINGIVAVPLIAIIIKIADDERIVGPYKNSTRGRIIGWTTFAFMGISAVLMLIYLL